jgi:hypothetical protein
VELEKPNTFVRALIVGLVLALCCLSYFNFFWRDPPFEISAGLLGLIALIIVLALSEIFDHLTFGKILSLKRKVSEELAAKESLREDNRDLRSQLMTLVANIQQSQVNNTFNAPPEAWARLLGVVPSSEAAAEESDSQMSSASVANADQSEAARQSSTQRYKRHRTIDSIAMRKYLDSIQVPQSERLLNAEFSASFQNIDPIMDRRIVFDAYIKAENRERFIEITRGGSSSLIVADRLYVMLTKIWLYRQAKKVQAELILLIVSEDGATERPNLNSRFIEYFQPAIANNILRIESVTVTAADIELELTEEQNKLR